MKKTRISARLAGTLLWTRFNSKKTTSARGSKLLRSAILDNVVSFTTSEGKTLRDVLDQLCREAGTPLRLASCSEELSKHVLIRGRACFGRCGSEIDKIVKNFPGMEWWVSEDGLHVEVSDTSGLSQFNQLAGRLMSQAATRRSPNGRLADDEYERIAEELDAAGFHARVAAAKKLGMEEVPTITLRDLTEDQLRAFTIADNRLAEKADWDKELLAIELQELINSDSFDITITGFEVPEIDLILEDARSNRDKDDDVEIGPTGPAVTRPDDVWHLGKHKLVCGNSLHESSYQALGKRRAQAVITDPPYNVRIDGNVCGKGTIKHREFAMAAGELSEAEYFSFLSTSLRLMVRYSANGSVHYLFIDWRHCYELLAAGRQVYEKLLNLCVWAKDNGGMGSFYRSRHELVFVFKNGKDQHRNNVQLGQFGRNRTNVWEYPGVNK